MRKIIYLLTAALLAIAAGCQKYVKAEEDSPFRISINAADVAAGDDVVVTVSLEEGVLAGDCRALFTVTDSSTGRTTGFALKDADGNSMTEETVWHFDKDGRAGFRLGGLAGGKYEVRLTVRRWFHTASAGCSFNVSL